MAAVEIEDEECNGRSGKRGRRGDSKTGDWSCQRVEEEPHIHNARNRPPNREETRLEGTLHLGSTLGKSLLCPYGTSPLEKMSIYTSILQRANTFAPQVRNQFS